MRTLFYLSYWCRIAISMMVMQAKWRSSHLLGKGRPSSLVMLSIWVLVQPWWSKLQPTLQTIPLPKELNLWQLSRKSCSHSVYNQRQNELRHFALNWAFLCFTDFKRGKYNFSTPIPSMQCCAAVQATYRKQQTSQLRMEGTEEECGYFCSLKLPYLRTIFQLFCGQLKVWGS